MSGADCGNTITVGSEGGKILITTMFEDSPSPSSPLPIIKSELVGGEGWINGVSEEITGTSYTVSISENESTEERSASLYLSAYTQEHQDYNGVASAVNEFVITQEPSGLKNPIIIKIEWEVVDDEKQVVSSAVTSMTVNAIEYPDIKGDAYKNLECISAASVNLYVQYIYSDGSTRTETITNYTGSGITWNITTNDINFTIDKPTQRDSTLSVTQNNTGNKRTCIITTKATYTENPLITGTAVSDIVQDTYLLKPELSINYVGTKKYLGLKLEIKNAPHIPETGGTVTIEDELFEYVVHELYSDGSELDVTEIATVVVGTGCTAVTANASTKAGKVGEISFKTTLDGNESNYDSIDIIKNGRALEKITVNPIKYNDVDFNEHLNVDCSEEASINLHYNIYSDDNVVEDIVSNYNGSDVEYTISSNRDYVTFENDKSRNTKSSITKNTETSERIITVQTDAKYNGLEGSASSTFKQYGNNQKLPRIIKIEWSVE